MHLILPVVFFSRFRGVISESRGVAAYAAHTQTCVNLRQSAYGWGHELSLMPDWAILDLYLHRCDACDTTFIDLLESL